MSSNPEWRAWADREFRSLMRPMKPSPPRYRCSTCPNRVTKNQAKKYEGSCMYCGNLLRTREFDVKP